MLSSGLTQEEIALVQGAADLEGRQPPYEQQRALELASLYGEVRGKLESAETALRQATAHGLEVATARLRDREPEVLAHEQIAGKVLTAQAVAAALARVRVAQPLVTAQLLQ